MPQSVAIIVAGGSGKRMLHNRPKQYLSLGGIPILARTLIVFEKTPAIDRIVVVVPSCDIAYVKEEIVKKHGITKAMQVQPGGETRQDSVLAGLKALGENDEIIVIHDGVRPFLTEEFINLSIVEASRTGAVVPVLSPVDTVKVVDRDGVVRDTPRRSDMRLAQTPQVFMKNIIVGAYERAYEDGFYGTDDASIVERMGIEVRTMLGMSSNIKITTEEDLALGEFILSRKRFPT